MNIFRFSTFWFPFWRFLGSSKFEDHCVIVSVSVPNYRFLSVKHNAKNFVRLQKSLIWKIRITGGDKPWRYLYISFVRHSKLFFNVSLPHYLFVQCKMIVYDHHKLTLINGYDSGSFSRCKNKTTIWPSSY